MGEGVIKRGQGRGGGGGIKSNLTSLFIGANNALYYQKNKQTGFLLNNMYFMQKKLFTNREDVEKTRLSTYQRKEGRLDPPPADKM